MSASRVLHFCLSIRHSLTESANIYSIFMLTCISCPISCMAGRRVCVLGAILCFSLSLSRSPTWMCVCESTFIGVGIKNNRLDWSCCITLLMISFDRFLLLPLLISCTHTLIYFYLTQSPTHSLCI